MPTGQGGGAERLARAFSAVWSKQLRQPFEYEFHAGAAGQVGYTLYVQKRAARRPQLAVRQYGPGNDHVCVAQSGLQVSRRLFLFLPHRCRRQLRVRARREPVQAHRGRGGRGQEAPAQCRDQPNSASGLDRHPFSRQGNEVAVQPHAVWRRQPDPGSGDQRRGRPGRAADRRHRAAEGPVPHSRHLQQGKYSSRSYRATRRRSTPYSEQKFPISTRRAHGRSTPSLPRRIQRHSKSSTTARKR